MNPAHILKEACHSRNRPPNRQTRPPLSSLAVRYDIGRQDLRSPVHFAQTAPNSLDPLLAVPNHALRPPIGPKIGVNGIMAADVPRRQFKESKPDTTNKGAPPCRAR